MVNTPYPPLRDFQNAHRKLLREYITAIDLASSLPFFVNLTKLLTPYPKESAFARLNRKSFFLMTLFTWKPFVRFFVDAHIKAKMGDLVIAYNQLALRLPEGKKYDPLRDALKSATAECNQLSDTLRTWKNGKTLMAGAVPVLAGWLTAWLGTNNLLSALPQLGIEITENLLSGSFSSFLQIAIGAITSAILLLGLLNQAFEGKRAIFLPAWILERAKVNTHNIYASEDALYGLMNLHKTPEFPLDIAALVIFFLFAIAIFILRFRYYSFSVIPLNLLALPVGIFLVGWIIMISSRRWN